MPNARAAFVVLVSGLAGLFCSIRAILKWYNKQEGSFVTIHACQESAILEKEESGSGLSFAEVVRSKIPALGPNARFNGVWWLPGCVHFSVSSIF